MSTKDLTLTSARAHCECRLHHPPGEQVVDADAPTPRWFVIGERNAFDMRSVPERHVPRIELTGAAIRRSQLQPHNPEGPKGQRSVTAQRERQPSTGLHLGRDMDAEGRDGRRGTGETPADPTDRAPSGISEWCQDPGSRARRITAASGQTIVIRAGFSSRLLSMTSAQPGASITG